MEFNQQNMMKIERQLEKKAGGRTMLILGAVAALLVVAGLYMLIGRGGAGMADLKVGADGKLTDAQTKVVKAKVAELIIPPQEEPVMAVVTAADSLIKEQAFYQGVQNGDILLIYPQAGKAILYSTSRDRLLNVGPVQVGQDTKKAAPAVSTPPAEEDESN